MSWLLHNAIADMYGPYFLAFYAIVIGVVILAGYRSVRSVDRTGSLEPPAIPAKVDPYEIAYLRGGENEVTRVAIASLIQRGLLEIIHERTFLARASKIAIIGGSGRPQTQPKTLFGRTSKIDRGRKPSANELRPIEACVLDWPGFPTEARSLFAEGGIPFLIEESCFPYEETLTENNLLAPRKAMTILGVALWLIGSALILGLGGYKLRVALEKGHRNVDFLCILGIAGVVLLGVACFGVLPRVSQLGKAYLERLELAFSGLKDHLLPEREMDLASDIAGESRKLKKAQAAKARSDALLLLGVFGIGALAYAPLSELTMMFTRGNTLNGGCGSGCGGGGDGGGGGCGGGCGGCGG
jgi:uncharacterized protein (TIGR04222 family)